MLVFFSFFCSPPFVGQMKTTPQIVLESADLKLTLDTNKGMMKVRQLMQNGENGLITLHGEL